MKECSFRRLSASIEPQGEIRTVCHVHQELLLFIPLLAPPNKRWKVNRSNPLDNNEWKVSRKQLQLLPSFRNNPLPSTIITIRPMLLFLSVLLTLNSHTTTTPCPPLTHHPPSTHQLQHRNKQITHWMLLLLPPPPPSLPKVRKTPILITQPPLVLRLVVGRTHAVRAAEELADQRPDALAC